MKSALITGITGQDGSYLAEFLLNKGYRVFGLVRRLSTPNLGRIQHILDKITLIEGDLRDQASLNNAVRLSQPDEVYNLAAQSFVATSWKQPELTSEITGLGTLKMLEAVKQFAPKARFYQASSSEMYGNNPSEIQDEHSKFHPRSPYAISKLYSHWIAINYRESYNMFICCGILFNHESPRRGIEFVTRKITDGIARIKLGLSKEIRLGNLDAKRDWGFAGDYVEAMWLMMQKDEPGEYVISSGEHHSVREFVEAACKAVGMDIQWEGSGLDQVGKYNGQVIVRVDPEFYRPNELHCLLGNNHKAKEKLSWQPKVGFEELVKIMIKEDIEIIKKNEEVLNFRN